jgi:hypothetical protein
VLARRRCGPGSAEEAIWWAVRMLETGLDFEARGIHAPTART